MDEEEICTPPEVAEVAQAANITTSNLLAEKSKKLYTNIYRGFLDWCSSKNVKKYTETVFLAYFSEKSSSCKPSTLWSHYSMLKATFNINNNIDISEFKKLSTYLKSASENHQPKKSKIFTLQDIEKFINEAPDDQFLMMKVVAIFGISGACRRHELSEILTDDIQDAGTALIITIRECKNKIPRTFLVVDNKDETPSFLQIYKKYASLRPPEANHKRFFVFYRNNKCTRQPVGINQFGKIPSLIAKFLNLPHPDTYTGHCFRRSSASLLADSGADITAIKRRGRCKSTTVAENSLDNKKETTEKSTTVAENSLDNKNETTEKSTTVAENSLDNKNETTEKTFSIKNQQLQTKSSTSQYTITKEVVLHKEEHEKQISIIISDIPNCANLRINVNVKKK